MEISVNVSGDAARLVVAGEIDESGAEEMKRRFGDIDLGKAKTVAFDFNQVSHIGSAGLGKLLLFYKAVAFAGGTMSVERVPPGIWELLQQLKLDTIFTVTKQ